MPDPIEQLSRLNTRLALAFGNALKRLAEAERMRKDALADLREIIGQGLIMIENVDRKDDDDPAP